MIGDDYRVKDELWRRFTYHKPSELVTMALPEFRTRFERLARRIDDLVPDSREKSLAITKLEESMMWAVAGIVRPVLDEEEREEAEEDRPEKPEYLEIKGILQDTEFLASEKLDLINFLEWLDTEGIVDRWRTAFHSETYENVAEAYLRSLS